MDRGERIDKSSNDAMGSSSMRFAETTATTKSNTIISSDVPAHVGATGLSWVGQGEHRPLHEDLGPTTSTKNEITNLVTSKDQDRDSLSVSKTTWQGAGNDAISRNNKTSTDDPFDDIRNVVGAGSVQVSDWINSNLIVARYAAYAGIGILAAYGISHSPLFFRYRTVADIPSQHFVFRRKLKCRLVMAPVASSETGGRRNGAGSSTAASWGTNPSAVAAQGAGPIRFQVRHLSLFERYCLVPSSWYDNWMRMYPSRSRPDENHNELLTVELAGVVDATTTTGVAGPAAVPMAAAALDKNQPQQLGFDRRMVMDSTASRCDSFLRRFVADEHKPIVTVQLVARRTFDAPGRDTDLDRSRSGTLEGTTTTTTGSSISISKKRRIPDHMIDSRSDGGDESISSRHDARPDDVQVAVAKVHYRSNFWQLFSTDLAHELVRSGLAVTTSDDGLFPQSLPHVSTSPPPTAGAAAVMPSSSASAATAATLKQSTANRQGRIVDTDRALSTLQRDARYLSWLDAAEHEAARRQVGAWSDHDFRQRRKDVVDEVEFQATAPWWKKAWRFIRGA